ncbi:MAG: 5-oxoprolinase subunit PxpB [Clostridiales bacterium]|nr:5-oxoprolinase subunit PxpB [Clostridiales bacterium]
MTAEFLTAGDTALVMQFGNEISEALNGRVKEVKDALQARPIDGITEVVPTFRSLLIYYKPEVISFDRLVERLGGISAVGGAVSKKSKKIVHIPVAYGGVYGEDIDGVSEHTGLSIADIISIHSATEYLVYMLGFLPGFPYLGGMDKRLNAPRLKNPRTKIPEGSVGIGGEQTGIYPLASPGGWRLIGRTPVKPYDPSRTQPFLYDAGDYIKFFPIDFDEYEKIKRAVDDGSYSCRTEVR